MRTDPLSPDRNGIKDDNAILTDEELSSAGGAENGERAMTYAPRPNEFVPCGERVLAVRGAASRHPGVLRRIYDAMFASRLSQADREIAAFLERSGGRFTDDIERRITQRLISGDWRR
jgi:hypothetical protein